MNVARRQRRAASWSTDAWANNLRTGVRGHLFSELNSLFHTPNHFALSTPSAPRLPDGPRLRAPVALCMCAANDAPLPDMRSVVVAPRTNGHYVPRTLQSALARKLHMALARPPTRAR